MVVMSKTFHFPSLCTHVLRFLNHPDEFKSYDPIKKDEEKLIEDDDLRMAYLNRWILFSYLYPIPAGAKIENIFIPTCNIDAFKVRLNEIKIKKKLSHRIFLPNLKELGFEIEQNDLIDLAKADNFDPHLREVIKETFGEVL